MGGFETWEELLGGILDWADIPGFMEDRNSFLESADPEGRSIRAFLGFWWDAHGGHGVVVSDLFPMVSQAEPSLELGEGRDHSQKVRLGRKLGQLRDQQFKIHTKEGEFTVRLEDAGTNQNRQTWRLVRV